MKKRIVHVYCLVTVFVFSVGVARGYSPPILANAAYTNSPFVTIPDLVGQCTWYTYGRIQEVGLITADQLASLTNRTGRGIFRGNASNWVADAVAVGFLTNSTPQVGALAVWIDNNHVAFVESVSSNTIQVTECNNKPKPGANVVVGDDYARLRSEMDASTTNNILWTMPRFTVMNVLSGPSAVTNGYQWIELTGNTFTGYVAWLDLDPSGPATLSSLQWNITQFKNSAASQWITNENPTYIHLDSQGVGGIAEGPMKLRVVSEPSGKLIVIEVQTFQGQTYVLEGTEDLSEKPVWVERQGQRMAGDGTVKSFKEATDLVGKRFYRVRVE